MLVAISSDKICLVLNAVLFVNMVVVLLFFI